MGLICSSRRADSSKHIGDDVNFDHFQILRAIGKGSFGKVCIVQMKDSGVLYAMKYVSRAACESRGALGGVVKEVELLATLEHPFLVNLWFSFQDEEDLFMVCDLLTGGDLRYHLQNKIEFSEESVALLVCELGSALDYLQSQRVVHRDVKPDNILLDGAGHAHLTDFNIATRLAKDGLACSMSGTKPYMAPEVFMCALDELAGYSFPVDWWSLGIVAYEMRNNVRPFSVHSNTTMVEVKHILSGTVYYPRSWSPNFIDLISKLLCVHPGGRISSQQELQQTPLLRNIDFSEVVGKMRDPPFKPPADHLNCDPCLELEEMIVEARPLHKKKKRLAKQRSLQRDSDRAASLVKEYRIYNRFKELKRKEMERKELEWEKELEEAMANSVVTSLAPILERPGRAFNVSSKTEKPSDAPCCSNTPEPLSQASPSISYATNAISSSPQICSICQCPKSSKSCCSHKVERPSPKSPSSPPAMNTLSSSFKMCWWCQSPTSSSSKASEGNVSPITEKPIDDPCCSQRVEPSSPTSPSTSSAINVLNSSPQMCSSSQLPESSKSKTSDDGAASVKKKPSDIVVCSQSVEPPTPKSPSTFSPVNPLGSSPQMCKSSQLPGSSKSKRSDDSADSVKKKPSDIVVCSQSVVAPSTFFPVNPLGSSPQMCRSSQLTGSSKSKTSDDSVSSVKKPNDTPGSSQSVEPPTPTSPSTFSAINPLSSSPKMSSSSRLSGSSNSKTPEDSVSCVKKKPSVTADCSQSIEPPTPTSPSTSSTKNAFSSNLQMFWNRQLSSSSKAKTSGGNVSPTLKKPSDARRSSQRGEEPSPTSPMTSPAMNVLISNLQAFANEQRPVSGTQKTSEGNASPMTDKASYAPTSSTYNALNVLISNLKLCTNSQPPDSRTSKTSEYDVPLITKKPKDVPSCSERVESHSPTSRSLSTAINNLSSSPPLCSSSPRPCSRMSKMSEAIVSPTTEKPSDDPCCPERVGTPSPTSLSTSSAIHNLSSSSLRPGSDGMEYIDRTPSPQTHSGTT